MTDSFYSDLRIAPANGLSPLKRVWEFGFNTDHAPMVMRSDLREHMQMAREQLGMRYWRCHGTLSDDVSILIEDLQGRRRTTFSGLKRILDAALSTGVKPFMELSFMPSLLARDPSQTITHYRGITSPPRDFAEWGALIGNTARFLADTYGVAELRSWYFEVWNEPNIPFWLGTQAEYFELYRQAALAIKRVDSRLRVGGPATARAAWVREFLDYCRATNTPVDFVSTHIYPSDIDFVDSDRGDVKLLGVDFVYEHLRRVQCEVAETTPGLPVIWGEWNSSACPFAANHDEANNAALVAAALAGIEEYGDGSLYWNLSDIYEEGGHHFAPFHGGYGLFTVDDIPKSAARAFELFHQLGDWKLDVSGLPPSPARGALASLDGAKRGCSVALWNHIGPADGAGQAWTLDLEIAGAKGEAELIAVAPGAGSAYETWVTMGTPDTLTPAQHKQLLAASVPGRTVLRGQGGRFRVALDPGTVALLQVDLEQAKD